MYKELKYVKPFSPKIGKHTSVGISVDNIEYTDIIEMPIMNELEDRKKATKVRRWLKKNYKDLEKARLLYSWKEGETSGVRKLRVIIEVKGKKLYLGTKYVQEWCHGRLWELMEHQYTASESSRRIVFILRDIVADDVTLIARVVQ